MFDPLRNRVLRLLRVPHDPDPPAGAPGSLVVFRAGRNYYKLRLLRWGLGQLGALIGIVFSLTFLAELERGVASAREPAPADSRATNETTPAAGGKSPAKSRSDFSQRKRDAVQRLAERWPAWLFPLIKFVEWFGVAIYLVQIPFTYALARLDYELRWYMVTDRSLRIRAGLSSVLETTMSFANIQQVVVTQDPLQRLLGIADVRVQSAGGGGDQNQHHGADASLHTGIFHGVANANQIRDVILDRLRQFREAGLGDPDEAVAANTSPAAQPLVAPPSAALLAARELLTEARALRQSLL